MKINFVLQIIIFILVSACGKPDPVISQKTLIELESCSQIHYKTIQDSLFVFVPNIFTPNGDGVNDVLLVGTNATIENLWFLLIDPAGHILIESQMQNELIFMQNIPDSSLICTFFLTGFINSEKIMMSGEISCVIDSHIQTYQILQCNHCMFGSAFDPDSLFVNALMQYNEFCP
jgi:hypothetical protein